MNVDRAALERAGWRTDLNFREERERNGYDDLVVVHESWTVTATKGLERGSTAVVVCTLEARGFEPHVGWAKLLAVASTISP